MILATAIGASGALIAQGAKAPATTPRLPEQAFETVKEEANVSLRDAYYALRRQNIGGGEFNAAAARAEAIQMKSTQPPATLRTGTVWTPLGPQPIQQGQTPQNGNNRSDCSGRANVIGIDAGVAAPYPVYLGTAQGGIWKSTDDGTTWSPITDFLGSLAVGSIAIDSTAHTATTATIYLGTGEANGSGDSYAGVGVYKSTNSGATWSGPFGSVEFTGRTIGSIVIDRNNPSILLVATASGIFGVGATQPAVLAPRGIYRSADAGLTWTCTTCGAGTDNNRYNNLVQDPVTATTWFAAGWQSALGAGTLNGGVVKSIDNGVTWTQVAGGASGLPAAAAAWARATIAVAKAPADPLATYYVGNSFTNAGQNPGRIYKSVDGGATWVQLAAANGYCGGQCFYDQPVWAQPDNPMIVYHGGAGAVASAGATRANVRRSTDGGTTFADIMISADATTAVHSDTHYLITDPVTPTTLWAACDGGVWRSPDRGTNWATKNSNINTVQFTGVDLHPATASTAYGGTQDNGTNTGSGSFGWAHSDDGDGGFALIDQTAPLNVVHTYFNQSGSLMAATTSLLGVASTPNDYTTIVGACSAASCGVLVNNGIPLSDRVLFYAPLALDRGATDTFYYGTNKLYRSPGFFAAAQTATPTTVIFFPLGTGGGQDLTAGGGAISTIETLAAQAPAHGGTNAAILYTGSSDGRVFRSTDTGASFTLVDSPNIYVSDLVINPSNSMVVYSALSGFSASAGQNVRKSIDGGTTWLPSGTGIPNIPVNALAVDPTDNNRIWAGTDIGVYVSFNSGGSWAPYGTGLPNVAVMDMKAAISTDNPTGQIVVATHGRGMWKLSGLTPAELIDFSVEASK
jgi:hypothetical protein